MKRLGFITGVCAGMAIHFLLKRVKFTPDTPVLFTSGRITLPIHRGDTIVLKRPCGDAGHTLAERKAW